MRGSATMILGVLLAAILSVSVHAAGNTLTELPVFVQPEDGSNNLMPNTNFVYDFVLTDDSGCSVVRYAQTVNLTTNKRGVGYALLNISGMTDIPNYICEYRNGPLASVNKLNPNIFRGAPTLNDMKLLGFNTTTELDARYASASALSGYAQLGQNLNLSGYNITASNLVGNIDCSQISGSASNLCTVVDTDNDTLATLTCSDTQVPKWNATSNSWVCAADIDTSNSYSAGVGLELAGNEFRIVTTCAPGEALQWSGANWTCYTPAIGTITAVNAGNGLVGGGSNGSVTLSVGAGEGIVVNPTNISIDPLIVPTAASNALISGLWTFNNDLTINGNLVVLGTFINATVENQYLNGSMQPSIGSIFDLGTPTEHWATVYADTLIGDVDYSQITNLPPELDTNASNDFSGNYNDLTNKPEYTAGKGLDFNGSEFSARAQTCTGNQLLFFNGTDFTCVAPSAETDPVFIAQNGSIWGAIGGKLDVGDQRYNDSVAISGKLDIGDQRYNDTGYIDLALLNYYTKSEVDNLVANASNISLDNYVQFSNTTDWDKNVSDDFNGDYGSLTNTPTNLSQFINDAGFLTNFSESDPVFNATTIDWDKNASDDFSGNWGDLSGVPSDIADGDNDTKYYNLSEFTNDVGFITGYNETDPLFVAENSSIWNAINNISLTPGPQGLPGVNGTSVTMLNVTDNNDGTYTWFFSDGFNFTTSNLTGAQGAQGVAGTNGTNGINGVDGVNGTSVNMSTIIDNGDGTYTWVFSDGYNFTTSNLTGAQGPQGIAGTNGTNGVNGVDGVNGTSVNISSVVNNGDGTYTWYFSDGYNFTTGNLTGPQGIQGVPGVNGVDGVNGTNGIDGVNGTSVTISNVIDNLDGTFTWQFSDGYNFTTSNLTGPQGIQGIQGIPGVNGTDGVNGTNGVDGINGTSVNLTQIVNNGDGTYIWVFSNGLNYTTGNLTGPQGIQGIQGVPGVNGTNGLNGTNGQSSNISVIDNFDGTFTLVLSYENGTNYANFTTSNLTGPQGIQGIPGIDGVNGTNGINGTSVSMQNVTNNGDGTYTWYFSDGFNFTTGNLTGVKGDSGINGTNGIDGINGTSVNITNVTDNFDGTFTWYFSDGYVFTTSNLTGPQGIQGIAGINGTNGVDGSNASVTSGDDYIIVNNGVITANLTAFQVFNDTGTINSLLSDYVQFANTTDWDKNASDDFNGSWSALTSVPAGFADGIDNDTQYSNLSEFTNDVGFIANNTAGILTTLQVRDTLTFGNTTPTAIIEVSDDGVVAGYNYDGAFMFKQTGTTPVEVGEFIFIENGGTWRFALPKAGVGLGTYNPRSMIIGGPSVNNASNFECAFWGFNNIDCNTGDTGADLGVQNDAEILGNVYVGTDLYIGGELLNISNYHNKTYVDETFVGYTNTTNWDKNSSDDFTANQALNTTSSVTFNNVTIANGQCVGGASGGFICFNSTHTWIG